MLALIQRVNHAEVNIEGRCIAAIEHGVLSLVGLERNDDENTARKLVDKIMNYRIFSDEQDRMNFDVQQSGGSVLWVSQFTLAANTHSGKRPGFESAMPPAQAEQLYAFLCRDAQSRYPQVTQSSGVFGAYMRISLENDGPVTFMLSVQT